MQVNLQSYGLCFGQLHTSRPDSYFIAFLKNVIYDKQKCLKMLKYSSRVWKERVPLFLIYLDVQNWRWNVQSIKPGTHATDMLL